MATLTVWVAPRNNDAPCYSLIGKTKKSVLEQLAARRDQDAFDPIEKRVIHYKDAFDLFDYVTSESGGR